MLLLSCSLPHLVQMERRVQPAHRGEAGGVRVLLTLPQRGLGRPGQQQKMLEGEGKQSIRCLGDLNEIIHRFPFTGLLGDNW